MAIDRNITININDVSPLANTAYVDAGKENKVYNKAQVNELVEDLREGTLGSISPSQTLQQLNALPDGNYYASEAGNYAFGVNVPVGWQFRFNKTGTTWKVLTKVEMKMQDLTPLENRITTTENKVDDFIENFKVNYFTTNTTKGVLRVDGTITLSDNWLTTDFINVENLIDNSYTGVIPTNTTTPKNVAVLGYKSDGSFVIIIPSESTSNQKVNQKFEIPEGVVKVRACSRNTQGDVKKINVTIINKIETSETLSNLEPDSVPKNKAVLNYFLEEYNIEIINYTKVNDSFISKTDGSLVSNNRFISSDFIDVTNISKIIRESQSYDVSASSATPISFYDENKLFVNSFKNGVVSTKQEFNISDFGANIKYVRLCGDKAVGLNIYNSISGGVTPKIKKELLPPSSIGEGVEIEDFSITLKKITESATKEPFYENNLGYHVWYPKNNNTPIRYYLIPKGSPSGIRTKFEMFGSDYIADSANYSALNILVYQNEIHIGCNKNGTATDSKQIIGGKYKGSSLISGCARVEYNIDNTVNHYGVKHTFENVLKLTPRTQPSSPTKGEIYFDSTSNKLRCFDGVIWNDLY